MTTAVLSEWRDDIKTCYNKLLLYVNEVIKFDPNENWKLVQQKLEDVMKKEISLKETPILELMNCADKIEEDYTLLKFIILPKLAPPLGMSPTHVIFIEGLYKSYERQSHETHNTKNKVLTQILNNIHEFPKITEFINLVNRGSVSIEIFLALSVCNKIDQTIDDAENVILGNKQITKELLNKETNSLSVYHPLQTMIFLPQKFDLLHSSVPSVILNFAGAKSSYSYKLENLIDYKRAVVYGGMASTTTGLNYNIISRLRTITSQPLQPINTSALPVDIGNLPFSFDNGATSYKFQFSESKVPALFSGCSQKIKSYVEITSDIILKKIHSHEGYDVELHNKYRDAIMAEKLKTFVPGPEIVTSKILEYFSIQYDNAPPISSQDFKMMIFNNNKYVIEAFSSIAYEKLDEKLRYLSIMPVRKDISFKTISREMNISQFIQVNSIANIFIQKMRPYFFHDNEVFTSEPLVKKTTLLKNFNFMMKKMFDENNIDFIIPSLKGYALTGY